MCSMWCIHTHRHSLAFTPDMCRVCILWTRARPQNSDESARAGKWRGKKHTRKNKKCIHKSITFCHNLSHCVSLTRFFSREQRATIRLDGVFFRIPPHSSSLTVIFHTTRRDLDTSTSGLALILHKPLWIPMMMLLPSHATTACFRIRKKSKIITAHLLFSWN